MIQVLTVYSGFFIITSFISFFVAFLAFQRKALTGAKELAWLMVAAGTGAFWIIFETAATTMTGKIFWSKLEYLGGLATPVLYLIFVLRFTGKDKFLSLRNILLLFLIPAFTWGLTLTNEKHNLIWSGFSSISGKTNLMEYYHGMWFWIGYIAYSYVMLSVSVVYLVSFIRNQANTFRAQALVVLAGGSFPWIINVIYLTGWNLVPGLDLTPVSITLSGLLAAGAILNFHFLDLVPVARETLVEILPDGIIALDSQNRVQDINKSAMFYLGTMNKRIIGHPVGSSGASRPELLSAATNNNCFERIEVQLNDETRTFSITKQDIRNQQGSRLVIIHDITDQEKAAKELRQARDRAEESESLKSAFLANMSHEIRTPMNGILGFAELLKMSDITGEEHQLYLDNIQKAGERMLSIINDIIDISKIESGQMQASFSNANINMQIESIASLLTPEAEAKGINLVYKNSLPMSESIIKTDPDKTYAIITKLASNAIKFTSSGLVEFGYEKKGHFLEFFVKDTGIGIPAEHKNFIFERFRQGSDSLTRNYDGAGLGLSISKAFVEMLGGNIWFESEVGKGSEFYFSLPYESYS
jgi:signal transduction histidine kinase